MRAADQILCVLLTLMQEVDRGGKFCEKLLPTRSLGRVVVVFTAIRCLFLKASAHSRGLCRSGRQSSSPPLSLPCKGQPCRERQVTAMRVPKALSDIVR
jgi:hypothetical protein